ncbi:MAG: hypothetical protein PW843_25810 [Azospirillaceae bacterium]|nr:hypothetical protein [Azospirillaceae bacterium]
MMRLLVLLLLILLPALAMAQELASTTVTLATGTARGDIVMRVTAPPGTGPLPLVLFSHGNFYSKDDYQPLVAAWAKAGFAVIQPTHLDARVLALPADDPRKPGIWRSRRDDLVYVLDHLDQVTAQAPALRGRVTASRVLVAGHSYGGHTVEMLLGARVRDPETKAWLDLSDARVAGGVLLAPPGPWADLAPNWKPLGVYLDVNWSAMRRPALVVVGELDHGPMSPRDWSWRGEAYSQSPVGLPDGAHCLLLLHDVGHFLGGIGGPNATEAGTNPAAVTLVATATADYLRTLAAPSDPAWPRALARLRDLPLVARAECR